MHEQHEQRAVWGWILRIFITRQTIFGCDDLAGCASNGERRKLDVENPNNDEMYPVRKLSTLHPEITASASGKLASGRRRILSPKSELKVILLASNIFGTEKVSNQTM